MIEYLLPDSRHLLSLEIPPYGPRLIVTETKQLLYIDNVGLLHVSNVMVTPQLQNRKYAAVYQAGELLLALTVNGEVYDLQSGKLLAEHAVTLACESNGQWIVLFRDGKSERRHTQYLKAMKSYLPPYTFQFAMREGGSIVYLQDGKCMLKQYRQVCGHRPLKSETVQVDSGSYLAHFSMDGHNFHLYRQSGGFSVNGEYRAWGVPILQVLRAKYNSLVVLTRDGEVYLEPMSIPYPFSRPVVAIAVQSYICHALLDDGTLETRSL